MEKLFTIVLSLLVISTYAQNLNLEDYPANYNSGDIVVNDSVVKFANGFVNIPADSSVVVSFTIPVRCSEIRFYGGATASIPPRCIVTLSKQDYSSNDVSIGGIEYYGMYARYMLNDESSNDYNVKTMTFYSVEDRFDMDSIKFLIDKNVTVESEYTIGYNDGVASVDTIVSWTNGYYTGYDVGWVKGVEVGYNNGWNEGIASIDTVKIYNNGIASVDTGAIYNNGVASVDVDSYWNDGYNEGIMSVDTTISWNNGVAYGLSQCGEVIDTVSIWNNGYTSGFDEGVLSGIALIDTVATWNNGYQTGYAVGLEDCQSTGKSSLETLDETIVYPNPTSDWITIGVNDLEKIEIYNANGILLNIEYNNTVSLGDYQTGTYFIRIYTSKGELGIVKVLRN